MGVRHENGVRLWTGKAARRLVLTSDTTHLDYFRLVREERRLGATAAGAAARLGRLRVAVLSDASTQHLVPLLRVLFARAGFSAELFAAEFDTVETQILDSTSELYRFAPDAVVLLPATNALRARYHQALGDRSGFGQETADRFASLWEALKKRSGALIVQANFVVPYERELGSYGLLVAETFHANVLALNAALVRAARAHGQVLLCDVEGIASYVGKKAFVDEKLWTMAKTYAALAHLPRVAQGLVDVVLAARGRVAKCVVLDLDDTLWGGVIGDEGLEGIRLGHFGEGEAFRRFQQYLRELARRGIALAVCSKNELNVAIRVFQEHPDMVLREEDIAVFVANWESKVDNLRRIRDTLEIGFDSMVFIDDNPFERNIVRQYLPEVVVPEMPEDPNDYVRVLSELNLFETASYTAEDRKRGVLYREEASRTVLASSFTNVDDYLRSLSMRVTLARFDALHLARIAQLIQRSNQFNLTTRRETQADCEALMDAGPDVLPIFVELADNLGEYGLVSVVIGRFDRGRLLLDTWIMSCRVLARGVEEYTMNYLVAAAHARGVPVVVGRYVPTSKNTMVKDFYARFGFEKGAADAAGSTDWTLNVKSYEPRQHFLAEGTR